MESDEESGSQEKNLAKEIYQPLFRHLDSDDRITLGRNTSAILRYDPKLVLFTLSKYKFAGKQLQGCEKVLEVGCMDGFGSLLLASFVGELLAVDFCEDHITDALRYTSPQCSNVDFRLEDFLFSNYEEEFDGVVSFDVWEHIDPLQSKLFLSKIYKALSVSGVAIIGVPSLESQEYASEVNKLTHINCLHREDAVAQLEEYFATILTFSMNDEVVHTGYSKMAHYNLYACVK